MRDRIPKRAMGAVSLKLASLGSVKFSHYTFRKAAIVRVAKR